MGSTQGSMFPVIRSTKIQKLIYFHEVYPRLHSMLRQMIAVCAELQGASRCMAEQHKVTVVYLVKSEFSFLTFFQPCGPQGIFTKVLLAFILVLFFKDSWIKFPKIHTHPKHPNVTLFENKNFQEVIYWE